MADSNLWVEMARTLRAIGQQLNRLASLIEQVHAQDCQKSTSGNRVAVALGDDTFRPDANYLHTQFCRRCTARGIHLIDHAPDLPSNPVERERRHLARFMVQHYPLIEPILAGLRSTLASPQKLTRNLANLNADELSIVTNICWRLYQLYMLEYYHYDRRARKVELRVRKQPFAQNFLSGQWFEMGVAEYVSRLLETHPHFVLRNARFESEKGGCFEVDILIGLWARHEFRLASLECKSACTLIAEELGQIRRVVNVLNLSATRCAVVFPKQVSANLTNQWTEQTGASFICLQTLPQFLKALTA